ncbi:MAG: cohesin domain-containing protein [candidate division KSB1 bacterium]|nr:cohesin domain-containing protein [candidate division KSB1 bacterium]
MQRSNIGLILGISLVIIAWGNNIGYGQVTVTVPEITTTPDTTVLVPVLVSNLAGYGIVSYQFVVLYDSMVVKATGITTENTLTAGWGNVAVNLQPAGQMVVGAFGFHELTGGGDTLVKLNFEVVARPGDSSKISLRDFSFNNDYPQATTKDGVIKITNFARMRDGGPAILPMTQRLIRHYPEPLGDYASFYVNANFQNQVTVEIRNLLGQRIREFEIVGQGQNEAFFAWDVHDGQGQIVAPGIYFCLLRQGGRVVGVEKLTVIR